VKPEQLELMFPLMVMATLVWASDELSEPRQTRDVSSPDKKNPGSDSLQQTSINPRQKEWSEKAVRRFAEAQEKQWRNWNEAMFEPD
jgi:hypothetical protein